MADRNLTRESPISPRHMGFTTVEGMVVIPPPSDKFDIETFPVRINPFEDSGSQEFPLGTRLIYADREFRYALNGAVALTVGKLCQSVVPLAGHIDEVVAAAAADATTITFTPAVVTTDDLAADELADGYIHINDDAGEGYLYRIKSHPAIAGAASGVLTLYDPIVVAITAASTATIYPNRYRKVIVHPSPPTAIVAGVTVCAVAADEYCWLQVKGPCPVLADGTLVLGSQVMAAPASGVDGAVAPVNTSGTDADLQFVGVCRAVNADTEYAVIELCLPGV